MARASLLVLVVGLTLFIGLAQGLNCNICAHSLKFEAAKGGQIVSHTEDFERCSSMPCNNKADFEAASKAFTAVVDNYETWPKTGGQFGLIQQVDGVPATAVTDQYVAFSRSVKINPINDPQEYRCALYDGRKLTIRYRFASLVYQYCIGVTPEVAKANKCNPHKVANWGIDEYPRTDDHCICSEDNCNVPFNAKLGYRPDHMKGIPTGLKPEGAGPIPDVWHYWAEAKVGFKMGDDYPVYGYQGDVDKNVQLSDGEKAILDQEAAALANEIQKAEAALPKDPINGASGGSGGGIAGGNSNSGGTGGGNSNGDGSDGGANSGADGNSTTTAGPGFGGNTTTTGRPGSGGDESGGVRLTAGFQTTLLRVFSFIGILAVAK